MGKSNSIKLSPKSPISIHKNGKSCEETEGKKFFACYLLTSLCPRFKGQTYIGFTVDPRRRIRQHNGEIGSGAWRTKRKRPWEMVICIYGFPNRVAALQFEWAWQHPLKSLAVRAAVASFKSVTGLANKIKVAHTMLTLPAWQSLNLTMNFFSTEYCTYVPGYRTLVCSMGDLPCYGGNAYVFDELDCHMTTSLCTNMMEESRMAMRTCRNSSSNHDDNSCAMTQHSDNTQKEQTKSSTSGGESQKPYAATSAADTELVSTKCHGIHHNVEVINISAPSPYCAVKHGSKKTELTGFPELIDLTHIDA